MAPTAPAGLFRLAASATIKTESDYAMPTQKTSPAKKPAIRMGTVRSTMRKIPLYAKIIAVLAIGLVGSYAISRSFADTSTLYVSPANTTINVGDTFTVGVRLNPVSGVDAVQTTLTYDPAIMQYVSNDITSSAFPITLTNNPVSGSITIARGIFAPATVSTDALIANITFKALTATAGTDLKLTGNSTSNGTYLNPGLTNGTVVINSVVAPAPAPAADTTPPKVTISNPSNGTKLGSKATVTAQSTDNTKVAKTELYIDNGIMATSTDGNISYVWNLKSRHVSKGTHTVLVKSYDTAGNVGSASVTASY